MPVDLHVHTNASDGTEEPGLVVLKAAGMGLEAVAITDHETVDGILPALEAGRKLSIEVVPGVELSTEEDRKEIHLLGYFIDFCCSELNARLEQLRAHRAERALKMIRNLKEMGIPLPPESVFVEAGRAAPGRPHIARALVKEGFAANLGEAFDRYLRKDSPAYVPRFKYPPLEAVQLIVRAGGVPVLAHPGLAGCDDLVPGLVKAGLMGLEVYYPAHSPSQVEHYLMLCRQYGLIPTGGSDYHGPGQGDHGRLAAATAPYSVLRRLREAAGSL